MNTTPWTPVAMLLALLGTAPVLAADAPRAEQGRPGKGLSEIPDPELNLMRGRYTVNGTSVAWFGVTMVSQWQAGNQSAQSALTLGMDFSHGTQAPKVSFTPSVTVTAADAPLPVTPGRSVDSSGLQNVAGLTQSVQVAGDNNVASNSTQLNVREGSAPPASDPAGVQPAVVQQAGVQQASAQQGGVSAVAQQDGSSASVKLDIQGIGQVQQWIRNGSVGQSIAISSDGQAVRNRMQIDLVRQTLASSGSLNQNVAQAMNLVRGVGMGPGQ
ncbi:hypothetical protein [uncultured Stenotrophomonas sp.]|uniref:hypothetical protein n=1 Tax=uncultured Stenotrophomonas sp. TaxID=165438 RepID=UPI0028D3DF23|nr:hypothetical protein [uncultured Stenotrophomonas sp.]